MLVRITALLFADSSFNLVCALDIVEHTDDDGGALSELTRVAVPGAGILLSAPLHPAVWTAFDKAVGHHGRYPSLLLKSRLKDCGLALEQSAVYGMQPRSSRLLDLGPVLSGASAQTGDVVVQQCVDAGGSMPAEAAGLGSGIDRRSLGS